MKKHLLFLVLCALPAAAQFLPAEPNPYGEKSAIMPVPDEACGNPADIITLDSWYYKHDAGEAGYTGNVTLWPYACSEAKTVESVSILGDSYSTFEGYVPDGNAIWYYTPADTSRTDVSRVEQTWWWQLTHSEGYRLCVNDSYSGATVSYTGYYGADYADRSFITRMPRLGNPDIILIFGAINDSWTGVGMGEYKYDDISREDLYLFRPAFAKMLSDCRRLYPDAHAYFILSDDLRTEINESTQEICAHYGVPLIRLMDIEKKSGHPTVRGMEQIKNQILENIRQ